MANWTDTSYHITGKIEDVKNLYELIDSFVNGKHEPMEKDADPTWEGNIALALGADIKNKYMRGFIKYVDFDGEALALDADEAWQVTDLDEILRSHYDGMKILYQSEEWEDNYFVTNDKDKEVFSTRFAIYSVVDGDGEFGNFDTEEEALKHVAERLGKESITRGEIGDWNLQHDDEEDENNISFNEYLIID